MYVARLNSNQKLLQWSHSAKDVTFVRSRLQLSEQTQPSGGLHVASRHCWNSISLETMIIIQHASHNLEQIPVAAQCCDHLIEDGLNHEAANNVLYYSNFHQIYNNSVL